MKRFFSTVLLVVILAWSGSRQGTAQSSPIFVIRQPTIIAFFPTTQAEVDSGADDEEALADFNYYVYVAEKRLHNAGVAIHVVNTRSFQIRTGRRMVNFQPKENEIGYYFIAPGKEPHIEHDVMSDEEILDAARKHFGITIR